MNSMRYFRTMFKPDLTETGYFTQYVYFKTNKYPYLHQCLDWLISNGHKPVEYVQGVAPTEGFQIPVVVTEEEFDNPRSVNWGGVQKPSLKVEIIEEDQPC